MPDGRYGRLYLTNSHALSLMECMAFLFMTIESSQSVDSIVGESSGTGYSGWIISKIGGRGMDEESIKKATKHGSGRNSPGRRSAAS